MKLFGNRGEKSDLLNSNGRSSRTDAPSSAARGEERAFVARPGRKHLAEGLLLGLAVTAWFGAIYATTDWVTELRTLRFRVHLDAELAIAFVPAAIVFYMSIYPLLWLGPFVLRTSCELRAIAKSMGLVISIAGIGFLLLPAKLAFPLPENVSSPWAGLYRLADTINLEHNLVPSLHVALCILCVDIYSRRQNIIVRLLLWSWGMAIAASTMLTHQHHLLDVATGGALAMTVSRCLYPRWADDKATRCAELPSSTESR